MSKGASCLLVKLILVVGDAFDHSIKLLIIGVQVSRHCISLKAPIMTAADNKLYESVLNLIMCMLGNCSCFSCLLTFIKINSLKKIFQGQTVWNQIRTNSLGPNCLKKVISRQQVTPSKERVNGE